MHDQPISAARPRWECVFCERSIASGAAVWRAGHSYHVDCLVRTITTREVGRRSARTGDVASAFGQPPAPRREPNCEPFQLNRGAS